jgi:hypothetical protein
VPAPTTVTRRTPATASVTICLPLPFGADDRRGAGGCQTGPPYIAPANYRAALALS